MKKHDMMFPARYTVLDREEQMDAIGGGLIASTLNVAYRVRSCLEDAMVSARRGAKRVELFFQHGLVRSKKDLTVDVADWTLFGVVSEQRQMRQYVYWDGYVYIEDLTKKNSLGTGVLKGLSEMFGIFDL